jgi:hypothetical protein
MTRVKNTHSEKLYAAVRRLLALEPEITAQLTELEKLRREFYIQEGREYIGFPPAFNLLSAVEYGLHSRIKNLKSVLEIGSCREEG